MIEQLDCYHRAEPDEPKFTLIARDPVAADFIRAWAFIRAGFVQSACDCMDAALIKLRESGKPLFSTVCDEYIGAMRIAHNMDGWYTKKHQE